MLSTGAANQDPIATLSKTILDQANTDPDPSAYAIKTIQLNTGVVNAGSKGALTTETGYRIGTPTFASDAYEVSFSSSYEYRATDSDGDYLEDGFTITFQPEPSNAVEPVAIDLNSNGVSYIPLEQSIAVSYTHLRAHET